MIRKIRAFFARTKNGPTNHRAKINNEAHRLSIKAKWAASRKVTQFDSDRYERAHQERTRKNAKRERAYVRTWLNYHPARRFNIVALSAGGA